MRIFRLHRIYRFYGLVGEAIARTHEVAVKLLFEHFDLGEPFARCGANPARYESARRRSVMLGQRGSIHVGGDECVRIERFFHGDAADKRWNFARNFIEPTEHYVMSRSLYSPTLQYLAQSGSGKPRGADGTFSPLHAGNLWPIETTSVARAF